MSNGFRAPRVVGQGSIQRPDRMEDNVFDVMKETDRYEREFDESQKRYDQDYYMKAIDQNLREKWLEHSKSERAFKEFEPLIGTTNQPKYPPGHAKAGSFMSFKDWYDLTYGASSQLAQQQMQQNVSNVQSGLNNPIVNSITNPFTGTPINKKPTPYEQTRDYLKEKGIGEHAWRPSKGSWGILSDINPFGSQEGRYYPGNRTGDKNPAMLEDGEYVLNRNAVKGLGKGFLDRINDEAYPRFQSGGFTGGMGPSATGGTIANPTIQLDDEEEEGGLNLGDKLKSMVGMQSGGFSGGMGPTATGGTITGPVVLENNLWDKLKDEEEKPDQTVNVNAPGGAPNTPGGNMNIGGQEITPEMMEMGMKLLPLIVGGQKGGFIDHMQQGGISKQLLPDNPYGELGYMTTDMESIQDQLQYSNYRGNVMKNMVTDEMFKRETDANWEEIAQDRRDTFNLNQVRTWPYVLYPLMEKIMEGGRGFLGYPTLKSIEKKQKSQYESYEPTPFPHGQINLTPQEKAWRDSTYYPLSGGMGKSKITDEDLMDAFRKSQIK
jgi:hypothetical protein